MARLIKKSWHEAFTDCVLPHTDAPENFITWAALSFIGAALKNNVFFEAGTYTLYPNMFIVLVAPPGVGKGTSMDLVEMMNKEDKLNKIVNTLSDRITAEAIIEQIAAGWNQSPRIQTSTMQMVVPPTDHTCLLFSTELRTLLSSSSWMLVFLEEAWSKKTFDSQTKNKGSVFIDNMCCSLLAASVPDFLRNVSHDNNANMVITGGFSSRCLFIYAEQPSKILPLGSEPLKKNKKSKALWDDLTNDLRAIGKLNGEFSVDHAARIIFDAAMKSNRLLAEKAESEAEANFRSRYRAHVLKLSMVFSVSRGDDLIINQYDMANAIGECNRVVENLNRLFRGAGEGVDASTIARIQDLLEKRNSLTKKEILRFVYRHMSSDDLDRALFMLEAIDFCERVEMNKKTFYNYKPPQKRRVGP